MAILSDPVVLIDEDSTRTYGSGSFTTGASAAPTAGSLLVAHVVYCTNGGGDPGVGITISDSGGRSWSEPVAQHRRQGSGTDWIGEAFFIADNASTSGFTVTVDTAAGTIWAWEVQVIEVPGGSGASIGATGSVSSTGNGAVNFALDAAPASGSYVIAGLGVYETNDHTLQVTEGAGWTEAVEAGRSVPNAQIQFRTGSTSDQVDWVDNGTTVSGYLALAFEVSGSAGGGVTGTVAVSTSAPTVAAAGSPTVTGTAGAVLPAVLAVAAGTPTVVGVGAADLPGPSVAAAGAPVVSGVVSVTLPGVTVDAAGAPGGTVTGTAAVTIPAPVAAAAGSPVVTVSVAVTLTAPATAAAGSPVVSGSVGVVTSAPSVAAAGRPAVVTPPEPPAVTGGGNRLFTPHRDDEFTDAELDALLIALLLAA